MNLANRITLLRVLLIPIFMIVLFGDLPNNRYIATFIFIVASATDGLDGYIARSRNQITTFGKFIDPLADKLLISAALISLVELGKLPSWIVILIIGREFTIPGFGIIAATANITIAASPLGKIKTVTQIIAILLLLLDNYPFRLVDIPMDIIMVYISLIFTIVSGIDYIYRNREVLQIDDR